MYLTIETLGHKLLAHKKYESSSTSTVLTFNNDTDQQLNLCVDNFEAYTIVIEVHLRYGIHLGDSDLAPTKNVGFLGNLFGDVYMGMYIWGFIGFDDCLEFRFGVYFFIL